MSQIVNSFFHLQSPLGSINELVFVLEPGNKQAHLHDVMRIVFLLDASYQMRLPDNTLCLVETGDILVIPPNYGVIRSRLPGARADKRQHAVVINLTPTTEESQAPLDVFIRQNLHTFTRLKTAMTPSIRSTLPEIRYEIESNLPGADIIINALVQTLIVAISRPLSNQITAKQVAAGHSKRHLVSQVKEYINKNARQPIALSELAAHVDLSEEYLCRLFKAETGTTFSRYLTSYRIESAKNLLLNSNLTVVQISRAVGFSSPNLLSRHFKAATGSTALGYRQSHDCPSEPVRKKR